MTVRVFPPKDQPTVAQTDGIMDRTTIVSVRTGRLGIRRKVDQDRVRLRQTLGQQLDREEPREPDGDMLYLTKQIIDCPEQKKIASLDGKARNLVAELALPMGLRAGSYLIADGTLEQVDDILETWRARRDVAVDDFLRVYSAAVEDARRKLGDLYDPTDYPPPDDVFEAFRVRVSYSAWGTPARLKALSVKIWRREQERSARELREAADEVRQGMRLELRRLVAHLLDVLAPAPDGSTRVFRDSSVEHLTDYLASFDARNVVVDDDLHAIAVYLKTIMHEADPRSIRFAPMARRFVINGLERARDLLAALCTKGAPCAGEPTGPTPTPPVDADDPGCPDAPAGRA